MNIRIGRIVDVISPAENSKCGANLVKLTLANSIHEVTAYAKELKDLDLLVEIMTTLLARESGIPMPEPVLAFSKDGNKLLFATIDVKYPDLTKRLVLDPAANNVPLNAQNMPILRKLSEWPLITESIAFDEWIANEDRHVGNVLFDGISKFMLIDNNLAMRPHFSPTNPITNNQLLTIHLIFNNDELSRQRIKTKLSSLSDYFDTLLPDKIGMSLKKQLEGIDESIIDRMVLFLQTRLIHLSKITSAKIPVNQQRLF